MNAPHTVGVVGAGTMGLGIALLAATARMKTLLFDPVPEALDRAVAAIEKDLARAVDRGRMTDTDAQAARDCFHTVRDLADLEQCELIIEAAPERLELKAELFAALPDDAILATNTSSLAVTAIAAHARRPENVVGMHFFNPPTRMKLVEVIAGLQTQPRAVELAHATVAAMGRTAIDAADDVGFIVNRCGRPFYAEALRLLDEGIADPGTIDRICRLGGGFRMGPFELMDLVGIDTGLDVMASFATQSYGEPRWKPSTAQHRLVAAGRLGRKTGRGWFAYGNGDTPAADPETPTGKGGNGRALAIVGEGPEADAFRRRAAAHAFDVLDTSDDFSIDAVFAFDAAAAADVPPELPLLVSCATTTLASSGRAHAVGFHILPPTDEATLIELTRGPGAAEATVVAAEEIAEALGFHCEWVDDAPALVLGRIVSQLVNEACFAVGSNVGSPEDIDLGLELGLNYPHGPVTWGARIGLPAVLARLDGLWSERHEDRYRAAPLLRRAVALDATLADLRTPERTPA